MEVSEHSPDPQTFTDEQVREVMQRYVNRQVDRKHLQEFLGIKKSILIFIKKKKTLVRF
jgi:hypothetical protein